MAADDDREIRLPLLWSLVDDSPDTGVDPSISPRRQLEELRESVRRDLEGLLNTRQRCRSCPPQYEELRNSMFDYGIVDLSGANLAAEDRRSQFLGDMARSIVQHDPRLRDVRVERVENADQADRTLRFRIEATLRVESESEETAFDFFLEPVSRRIQ